MDTKPKPYCTRRMIDALDNLRLGHPVPALQWWPLKSRGWINWKGNITRNGLAYLTARGYIGDSIN